MPRGDQSVGTDKQKHQAEHVDESKVKREGCKEKTEEIA